MKLHTAMLLAFANLTALACGSGGGSVSTEMASVPVTAPWDRMNLPLEGGAVTSSSDSQISVMYSGVQFNDTVTKWNDALQAAGFRQTFKSEQRATFAATYSKEGTTLNLGASDAMGHVTIALQKI